MRGIDGVFLQTPGLAFSLSRRMLPSEHPPPRGVILLAAAICGELPENQSNFTKAPNQPLISIFLAVYTSKSRQIIVFSIGNKHFNHLGVMKPLE